MKMIMSDINQAINYVEELMGDCTREEAEGMFDILNTNGFIGDAPDGGYDMSPIAELSEGEFEEFREQAQREIEKDKKAKKRKGKGNSGNS
jgi:hypothetical protein